MKPSKHDKRYQIRITGLELVLLHKLTGLMCEAYGLDRKIGNYKGTRAITLYSWDLDCLKSVTASVLRDPPRYDINAEAELVALTRLDERFRELHRTGEDA